MAVQEEYEDDYPTAEELRASASSNIMMTFLRRLVTRKRNHPTEEETAKNNPEALPAPSPARLKASLAEDALDIAHMDADKVSEQKQTFLYLAYGSNMCFESFQRTRGIRPLAKINVLVPELRLTFDLPGMPYLEPCFANTAHLHKGELEARRESVLAGKVVYNKDKWYKPLPGIVYEVESQDYVHIIATEGGGSAYQDVLVTCYPQEADPSGEVPMFPTTEPFKAHTLVAPSAKDMLASGKQIRLTRTDPAYAQPSPRYLNLLRSGVREHGLPDEYDKYLSQIRPYVVTTRLQMIAQTLFVIAFGPWIMMLFALQRKFSDKRGNSPPWLAKLRRFYFAATWVAHDWFFKPLFGNGERTMARRRVKKKAQ